MMLLIVSCATSGPATSPQLITEIVEKPVYIDTACKWVKPILVSRNDNVTDETARQILAHNRAFEANCGKPKK